MHFRIVLLYFYANYYIYALCIITLIFTWSRHKIAVPSMTRLYSYLTNQNMFSSLFDSQFNILTKYKESLDENMNPRYPSNENMNLRIWIFDILRMRIWISYLHNCIIIKSFMHTFYQVVTYTYNLITFLYTKLNLI